MMYAILETRKGRTLEIWSMILIFLSLFTTVELYEPIDDPSPEAEELGEDFVRVKRLCR